MSNGSDYYKSRALTWDEKLRWEYYCWTGYRAVVA